MVYSCAVIKCTENWGKEVNIKFHSLPKDLSLRKTWLHALRRVDYNRKRAFICEKHFLETDKKINVHGNKILRKGSVPSVFDFPDHLIRAVKKRRILVRNDDNEDREHITNPTAKKRKRETEEKPILMDVSGNVSVCDKFVENIQEPSTSKFLKGNRALRNRRELIFFGDFTESNMNNEERRKRLWHIAHKDIFRYRKPNKYYQCKVRRQGTQIRDLNAFLEELKETENISLSQLLVLQIENIEY